ncbi:MAG TPA: 1,4-dihydroxy-2-naphthoate octaprenyltransferase [Candidatus Spyradosoma merdigallinarum]|uniref:1,4-dihydroxy-2-naphthoate octaprenyltransferase n=1 Tax=Candidatus Spyradosoma merdigallinarum TaxID=2840950 RepID=A0A9D1NKJ6_9BACT|nr:1,4-dihydroxy-2-naphthoate octaprenyltransferase [Candidatus Spyradosoma merdigallinarum]
MKRAAPAGKTPPKALAFFFAARPKTLPAALAPVLLGSACAAAAGGFRAVPAALAALFALFAQIASNLANDRGDFLRGTDKADRAGFARATASGWLSPREVAAGTGVALALAALFGSGLIFYGGAAMIAVGAISLLACLAYTTGPFPLSYHGLGDVFVVVFFGFVAVAFTCYVQAGTFPPFLWTTALACGLGADNILIVNNIRDRATDERSGKRTTVVRFGEAWARKLFAFNFAVIFLSPLALRFAFGFDALTVLLPMILLPIPIGEILKNLREIKDPRECNPLLAKVAGTLLLYAVSQSVGLFLSAP